MANVLKVFLENGQTKSFKYDAWTTVQDVVSSLQSKLCLQATEHFSLVVEHIKSVKRNKLTLLDPSDTLARVSNMRLLSFLFLFHIYLIDQFVACITIVQSACKFCGFLFKSGGLERVLYEDDNYLRSLK